MQIPKQI